MYINTLMLQYNTRNHKIYIMHFPNSFLHKIVYYRSSLKVSSQAHALNFLTMELIVENLHCKLLRSDIGIAAFHRPSPQVARVA